MKSSHHLINFFSIIGFIVGGLVAFKMGQSAAGNMLLGAAAASFPTVISYKNGGENLGPGKTLSIDRPAKFKDESDSIKTGTYSKADSKTDPKIGSED